MLPTTNTLYFDQEILIRTDKVFVSFSTTEIKRNIWQKYKISPYRRIYRGIFQSGSDITINNCNINLETRLEPTEIDWENLEVTSKIRYKRIVFTTFLTTLMLTMSFILIAWLSKFRLDT
jgi:hypothetical protein